MYISVVMPAHDPDEEQIRYALLSSKSQLQGIDHEMILIDDQSSSPLETLAAEFCCRYVRTESELFGLESTNLGIRLAQGDWVHVLHPDDFVLQGFYREVLTATERTQAALIATRHLECDEMGRPFHAPVINWLGTDGRTFQPLHLGNPLAVAACVVRRSWYQRVGGWNSRLIHTADWHAWARATVEGGAALVDRHLAIYRHSGNNHTSRLLKSAEGFRDYLRCAEECARFMSVDMSKFREYVRRRCLMQMYRSINERDTETANAHRELYRELEATS